MYYRKKYDGGCEFDRDTLGINVTIILKFWAETMSVFFFSKWAKIMPYQYPPLFIFI